MISKDGEFVSFKNRVKVSNTGVKEWLKALETEMKNTLALLLRDAVFDTDDLPTTSRQGAQVKRLLVFFLGVKEAPGGFCLYYCRPGSLMAELSGFDLCR